MAKKEGKKRKVDDNNCGFRDPDMMSMMGFRGFGHLVEKLTFF